MSTLRSRCFIFSLSRTVFGLLVIALLVTGAAAQRGAGSKPKPKAPEDKPLKVVKNSIGMEFVVLPYGDFLMGSSPEQMAEAKDNCRSCSSDWLRAEGPQRWVIIGKGIMMGRYEVTQRQWVSVMGSNPSEFAACGLDCPVETVSWHDAKEFVETLNLKKDGFVYSLPTEAEWEYAARAGTRTQFAFGDTLSSTQANFNGEYPFGDVPEGPNIGRTVKVGSYKPNAWGIFDMHGNVAEWVEDMYASSYEGLPKDGSANDYRGDPEERVVRDTAYSGLAVGGRSASRSPREAATRESYFGFRIVARRAR